MQIEHAGAAKPGLLRSARAAALLGATALAAVLCAPAAGWAAPSGSAEGAGADAAAVQEVVITARHRTENLEKAPVAASVLGGALLSKTNTTNIAQVSLLVPSLSFSFVNARNANLNIRGLGNAIGLASDGLDPGVGFYVDGVYYDRPATATFDLVDIDQVEVLRGPQGSLFGKNTTAGAVVLTTASPTFHPEATAEVSGGNWGYFQAKAAVSGPLIGDVLAGRLTVATTTHEGYLTNAADDGKHVNAYRDQSYRGQLLYTPDANFKLRLIGDYSKQNTNCCYLVYAGATPQLPGLPTAKNFTTLAENATTPWTPVADPFNRRANSNSHAQAIQETGGFSAQADYSLPKATLTSITAWRFWNWWPANDADGTPLSILLRNQNGDYQHQFSQEFRIASSGKNLIDYVGGLYFFHEETKAVLDSEYGSDASAFLLPLIAGGPLAGQLYPSQILNGYNISANASYKTTSFAAFGQAVWHITSQWSLTGGLRYTYDHKDGWFYQSASGPALTGVWGTGGFMNATGLAVRDSLGVNGYSLPAGNYSGNLSGQVNLAYQATPTLLAYVDYARGYKSAALNLTQLPVVNGVAVSPVAAPESIDAVEIGIKQRLFDRRVTLNADLFWEQDNNYQANVLTPVTFKQYLANVPQVRSQGVEVDVQAQPTETLSLYVSGTWDDAVYAKFPAAPCALESLYVRSACDLSGSALSGVPRWSLSAGGEFHQPVQLGVREGQVYIGADYSYRSSIYSSSTDSVYSKLPPLNLLNARIGVRSTSAPVAWDAYLWVKNLNNAKYFLWIAGIPGSTGGLYGQLGDPQTWGATIRFHY